MTSDAKQECFAVVKMETGGVGTGFLAQALGMQLLITAMHVPLGTHQHVDWQSWPKMIGIKPDVSQPLGNTLRLFQEETLIPDFLYVKSGDVVADFMAFHIPPSNTPEWMRSQIRVHSLEAPENKTLKPGDSIYVHGYPKPLFKLTSTPHLVHALPTADNTLQTEAEIVCGNSGGPVLDDAGNLVGMAIGSSGGRGSIISTEMLLTLLKMGRKTMPWI